MNGANAPQSSRLQTILASAEAFAKRENSKTWKERMGDSVRDFYHLGKGIARSGLKLIQNGIKSSPPGVLFQELSRFQRMTSDFRGYTAGQERARRAALEEIGNSLKNPAIRLRQLWEGSQDYLTAKTIAFLEAPRSQQTEALGEMAGDLAPLILGARGGINAVKLPPIPGGGLLAHEGILSFTGARSHTIAKHVGKNLEEMKELLKTQKGKRISSFRDLKSSEKLMRIVLKKERAKIQEFASQPDTPGVLQRLPLRVHLGRDTGDTYRLGAERIVPGRGVHLLLEKTPDRKDLPFSVHTFFPVP